MKAAKLIFLGLATGLLALGGWKAFSHFKRPPLESSQAAVKAWVCPMRCLNKLYDHDGECDVCHMRLKPYRPAPRKLLGYTCPLRLSPVVFDKGGPCPF